LSEFQDTQQVTVTGKVKGQKTLIITVIAKKR